MEPVVLEAVRSCWLLRVMRDGDAPDALKTGLVSDVPLKVKAEFEVSVSAALV
jgi:hypothetical protein